MKRNDEKPVFLARVATYCRLCNVFSGPELSSKSLGRSVCVVIHTICVRVCVCVCVLKYTMLPMYSRALRAVLPVSLL